MNCQTSNIVNQINKKFTTYMDRCYYVDIIWIMQKYYKFDIKTVCNK